MILFLQTNIEYLSSTINRVTGGSKLSACVCLSEQRPRRINHQVASATDPSSSEEKMDELKQFKSNHNYPFSKTSSSLMIVSRATSSCSAAPSFRNYLCVVLFW